jgi:hypothetical protein
VIVTAIEPITQIQREQFDTPFVEDLQGLLKRLAILDPSTDAPYLTLTLDWRPDGTRPNLRTGRHYFDQQVDEIVASSGFQPHTPPYESLNADIEQIRTYLDGAVDATVQGLAFVTCSFRGIFEPIPLGMPLTNRYVLGPTPALRVLAKLAEDEPTYAVLLSDQKHAKLMLVDQAARQQSIDVNSTGFPRKQQQGGWSQRRYQMRADERVEAFARTVAEETRRLMDETRAELLVLAGNEQITTTLRDDLHPTIQERVAGMLRLDARRRPNRHRR